MHKKIFNGVVGCNVALFIKLFICLSSIMANLLLCYHSTALCTSKVDTSASNICPV